MINKKNGLVRVFIDKKELIFKPPKGAFFSVNKKIILGKEVAWLVGFYLAEGLKDKNTVGISNKEVCLLRKSLSIFEQYFGIKKDMWKVYISSNKTGREQKALEERWEKKLKKKLHVHYCKFAFEEVLDYRINSRILSAIFHEFIQEKIEEIITTKDLAEFFLRGYAIGDGTVLLRDKQIHSIAITVKNKENKDYLVKACELCYGVKPNIRMTKGCYEVSYCHVKIITEIILSGIFKDLKRQWIKLVNGYKNKQYTRSRMKYWGAISSRSFHAEEIARISGNSHWSVRDALNQDISRGLVAAEYKNINRIGPPNKCYYLTQKGLKLLEIVREVNTL